MGAARDLCRIAARNVTTDSNMHHAYGTFLACVLDDTETDHRRWLARLVDRGLGVPVPLASWSDNHEAQLNSYCDAT